MGWSLSGLIRCCMASPDHLIVSATAFVTLHAILMIFFMVMPVLLRCFGNFMLPRMCMTSDMMLPRMNNLALWIVVASLELMTARLLTDSGPSFGWTLHPPLSSSVCYSGHCIDLTIAALHSSGLSRLLGCINIMAIALPFVVLCHDLTLSQAHESPSNNNRTRGGVQRRRGMLL